MGIRENLQLTTKTRTRYWSLTEVMPPAEIKKLQQQRLEEQLHYCWDNSPFYRQKWEKAGVTPKDFNTLEGFMKIPFIGKDEIRQSQEDDPPYGMMRVPGRGPITRIAMTSGTTGKPVLIPFTEDDYYANWCEGVVRSLTEFDVGPNDIVHPSFGFTPFVGLHGAYDSAERLLQALVIPGGAWDSKLRVTMIQRLKITVLMGTPTYMLHLGKTAQEMGMDPTKLGVRVVFTTGEPGAMSVPSTKARIEEMWGCEYGEFSGTQETEYIAYLCREGNAHVNEDLLYFEVLNPETEQPVEPGEQGMLVITDLLMKTHPLIRFPTGDLIGGIMPSTCPCGRTLSQFKGFKGRIGDIIKIRGVTISTSGIENVVRSIPETSDNYEYVATNDGGMDKVTVRLEPKTSVPKEQWPKLREKVAEELRLAFMISMDVEVVAPGELPVYDFKAKRFVDHRKWGE